VISSIEVQNFKGFRDLKLSALGSFHVLAGPNGSGKSSFFEILEFVKDLLLFDVQEAVSRRNVSSLRDLTFDRQGGSITLDTTLGGTARYLLSLSASVETGLEIVSESLIAGEYSGELLMMRNGREPASYKREDESDFDYFSFPLTRTALSQTPPDETRYPTVNRAKKLLTTGVQLLRLDSPQMGAPCPPSGVDLLPDGRNLARIAGRLLRRGQAAEWIYHLRLALEDLEDIAWRQREDGAEYLVLRYRDGLEIPSWLASFGTLRTLALTLPAFLPADEPRLYLFEEPENGIHPKAIEIVMNAIETIPFAQTFVTTHSPMVVEQAGRHSLLLFSRNTDGITIQRGDDHPVLKDWDGVPDLGTVVASGILG
jgi:predicted ATPase